MTGRGPLGGVGAGDRVALLATAGPAPAELVERAVALVAGWGLEPVVYPSVTAAHGRAEYLSGDDRRRAADVVDAWCDPEVAAMFCVRGGYGTVRILDLLDLEAMRTATPKPLYGSSDVTALHEWFREQLGVATWFTPMLATLGLLDDARATAALRRVVLEPAATTAWTSAGAETLVPGRARGRLIGGNLSLLAMTLGARRRPRLDNRGCLGLLEDVGEEPYRIDGYLQALLRAGWFEGVAGVALGSWHECGDPAAVRALCFEALAPLGVPVVWDLGFGHGPGAHSIPLGVAATLVADDDVRLVLEPEGDAR